MSRFLRWACLLLALFAIALLADSPARSCAPAFRKGASVRIANESALIIWDADNKTEHFIRRGTFDTTTPDFGFLVPTPTKPELEEADDNVFSQLENWTRPDHITHHVPVGPGGGKFAAVGMAAPAMAPAVEVLGHERVAGLDAVMLKASDSQKLLEWLKKHGYESRPALEKWLDRYVKDGWVITAFKVDRSKVPIGTNVSTKALRMTFKTDKPFYPYREPEDMRTLRVPRSTRLLRVFVLATDRMEGLLGEGPGAAKVGKTVWSDHIQPYQRDEVLNWLKIKDSKLAPMPRLTVIEDTSSPRPGTEEMYLRTSPDQSTKKRPPIVTYVHVHAGGMPAGSPPSVEGLGFAATLAAGLSVVMMLVLVLWFYRASRGEVEG